MHLICHQFKTDWIHFRRGLLVLWLAYAAQLLLGSSTGPMEMVEVEQDLLPFFQILAALWLLPQIIQADSLVGASAQWLTRPLRRPHLFAAKSAFILVCVVLPRLVPPAILCIWHQYPWAATVASLAGILVVVLAVVGTIVALAALTPDPTRFFLSFTVMVAAFLIWSALLSVHYSHVTLVEDSLSNSTTLATFLLLGACALVVWIVQVFAGQRVLGYALLGLGVLVVPCIQNMWRTDFLVPRLTPMPALPVTSVTATNLPVPGTGSQLLWSAFAVAGLPTNGIVVAESGGPTFNPNSTNKTYHLGGFRNYAFSQIMTSNGVELNRLRPIESGQQEAYVALLHAFFPPETLWTDLPVNNWSGFTGMDEVYKETAARPIRGGLYWSAEFDQFKVFPALRVALRPGVWTLAPGSRLVIHSVSPGPNSITVTVEEISATPPLLPSVYGGLHNVYTSHSRCTYVLYHPDGGQAELLGNQLYSFVPADFLGGESHQYNRFEIAYPVLPARLLGLSWREYLDKAVLCVFMPVYQGTFHQTFQESNFDLARVQGQSAAAGDDQKSQATLQSLTLPTAPTAAQIGDYLDHLLQALPDNSDAATRKLIQSRLAAIGTAGVPLLLDHLPWERNAEMFYLFPYLTTYATRDQLPDLRAALARDLNLADWFKKMKWDDAARETLVGRLSDHRQAFPPVALELAAGARNPATYADLQWHFVRLEYQQQAVATALAECPGFDLNGAIREAWQRVLLGLNPPGDLPFLAAKLGLPDAFNQAVMQVESRANLSQQAKDRIQQLAALTEFPGPPDAAQAWLSARLGRFQYDPATGRYRLNGGGP